MNKEATPSCEVLTALQVVPATEPLLGPETYFLRSRAYKAQCWNCDMVFQTHRAIPALLEKRFMSLEGFLFCFVLGRALFEEVRDGGTYWFSVCSLGMKLSSLKFKTSCKSLKFILLY